jgi:hypothetical protein
MPQGSALSSSRTGRADVRLLAFLLGFRWIQDLVEVTNIASVTGSRPTIDFD